MRDVLGAPPAARHPDTVFLLALLLTAGVGQLLSGAESGTVAALVSRPVLYGWSITLTAGAGITLAGVLWKARVTGLLIEAVGRAMFAPASLAYALAIFGGAGTSGLYTGGLLLGLFLSSGWRLWYIRKTIRHLREDLADLADRQETGR